MADYDKPSRERFEAALAHKKHDRVPVIEFIIDPVNLSKLAGRDVTMSDAGLPTIRDISSRLGFDLLPSLGVAPFYAFPEATEAGRYREGGLQTRDDILAGKPFAPLDEMVEGVQRSIDYAAEEDMGTYVFFFGPFTSVYCGMGIDNFWVKTCEDPAFIEEALDRANDQATEVMEAVCELDVAMILMADDVAFNQGLMLDPAQFRELWMPRTEQLLAPARAKNKPIMLHNCGNWTDLLPLADELGVTAIEPLQPTCNDIYQIKKDWGERFCILGNIDIAGPLAFGTPEDVRADVREHIDRLAGDGGYVVHSSHSINDRIPLENFLAMCDEARTYGRYT